MLQVWSLIDRGAVLFVGMAVGAGIAFAFLNGGKLPGAAPAKAAAYASPPIMRTTNSSACQDNFPISRRVIGRLRVNRPLRIAIFGDSFGEGVGWAATQTFGKNRNVEIYRFAQEGTGFTRYGSLNLLEEAKTRISQQPVDIALISFGANDTQGVWFDGKAAAYMSKPWQKLIGARAKELLDYLRSQGIAVGWIGLPRMRKDSYDNDVQAMNAFYADLMCKEQVPFVNPVAVSEDSGHHFALRLTDPLNNKSYEARAQDGIHMSMHGYQVISRPLTQRIQEIAAMIDDGETRGVK